MIVKLMFVNDTTPIKSQIGFKTIGIFQINNW